MEENVVTAFSKYKKNILKLRSIKTNIVSMITMFTPASTFAVQQRLTFSTSTVTRCRKMHHQQNAKKILNEFEKNNSPFFVVHWDSK